MKRFYCLFALILVGGLFAQVAAKRKPAIAVQLYGDSMTFMPGGQIVVYEVFLILPDGSHARANCSATISSVYPCRIEPFAAEKRVTVPCELITKEQVANVTCYQGESYWAGRKNNDITLSAANGNITYHIYESW